MDDEELQAFFQGLRVNTGALLMSQPGLPRWPSGHPYQVLFAFDGESRAQELIVSPTGDLLVWTEVESDDCRDWTVALAPPEVAAAARATFHPEMTGPPS